MRAGDEGRDGIVAQHAPDEAQHLVRRDAQLQHPSEKTAVFRIVQVVFYLGLEIAEAADPADSLDEVAVGGKVGWFQREHGPQPAPRGIKRAHENGVDVVFGGDAVPGAKFFFKISHEKFCIGSTADANTPRAWQAGLMRNLEKKSRSKKHPIALRMRGEETGREGGCSRQNRTFAGAYPGESSPGFCALVAIHRFGSNSQERAARGRVAAVARDISVTTKYHRTGVVRQNEIQAGGAAHRF
jgi:hypothetical protein